MAGGGPGSPKSLRSNELDKFSKNNPFTVVQLDKLPISIIIKKTTHTNEVKMSDFIYESQCDEFESYLPSEADLEEYADYLDSLDNDGQPDEYTEWQDYMGGDDWDHGQYSDF